MSWPPRFFYESPSWVTRIRRDERWPPPKTKSQNKKNKGSSIRGKKSPKFPSTEQRDPLKCTTTVSRAAVGITEKKWCSFWGHGANSQMRCCDPESFMGWQKEVSFFLSLFTLAVTAATLGQMAAVPSGSIAAHLRPQTKNQQSKTAQGFSIHSLILVSWFWIWFFFFSTGSLAWFRIQSSTTCSLL